MLSILMFLAMFWFQASPAQTNQIKPSPVIPKISVVPDCSTLPACPNSQPRQPWHNCQCKPTPACKNICIIGATSDDMRSCWNHLDYENQTTDTLGPWYTGPRGTRCAWSYSPGTYTKVPPVINPPLPQ